MKAFWTWLIGLFTPKTPAPTPTPPPAPPAPPAVAGSILTSKQTGLITIAPDFSAPRGSLQWYQALYIKAEIRQTPHAQDLLSWAMKKVIAGKPRYQACEVLVGVPWALIAAIHGLEASFSFETYLGNGDPLNKKTVHVPAGRGPFATWEAGAADAFHYDGAAAIHDWSIARMLQFAEKYNGTGYLNYHTDMYSPYLWSCTSLYAQGKYVADGKFSPTAVSDQVGVAAIFKALEASGEKLISG